MNFGMLRARFALLGLCCAPLLAGAAGTACGDKKGGLMLSISTDMKAPKDVSVVSLTILTNNQVKYNFIGRVLPNGDVKLPATIAIAEPDDKGASIRIRVIAFQERKPRVLRDVRTSVPHGGRVALLRMPLNFIDDGSGLGALTPDQLSQIPAMGQLPPDPLAGAGADAGGTTGGADTTGGIGAGELDPYSQFDSICGAGDELTQIDGECVDSTVDPDTLPDFDQSLVGDGQDMASCFDVKKCLAGAQTVMAGADDGDGPKDASTGSSGGIGFPDASADSGAGPTDAGKFKAEPSPMSGGFDAQRCLIDVQGRDITKLNLALQTQGTGECLADGRCFVPLDHGDHGWREAGSVIQLAPGICKKISAGGVSLVEVDTGVCAPKEEKAPVCNLGEPVASGDGGVGDGGKIEPGGATASLIVADSNVRDVIASPVVLYLGGASRFASVAVNGDGSLGAPQTLASITPQGPRPYRFVPTGGPTFAVVDGTATAFVVAPQGSSTPTIFDVSSGGAVGMIPTAENLTWAVLAPGKGGGIWTSPPGGGNAFASSYTSGGMQVDLSNISAITAPAGPGSSDFIMGTTAGTVRGCNFAGEPQCGPAATIAAGAHVDAFAQHGAPQTGQLNGYVLTSLGLYKANGDLTTGAVTATLVPLAGSTAGTVVDPYYFPRSVSPEIGQCVFVSTVVGIEWVGQDAKGVITRGVLVNVPSGRAAGVAIFPVGVAPSIFFAVDADVANGGGLWQVAIPTNCLKP